jgi:hypothetical protein
MNNQQQPLLTPGVIARHLRVPVHRVEYVIRSRQMKPHARAGILRIFTPDDMGVIASALGASPSDVQGHSQEGHKS